MEEVKKELAELKELVSKLLEIEKTKFDYQYSWLNKPLSDSTSHQS